MVAGTMSSLLTTASSVPGTWMILTEHSELQLIPLKYF